MYTFNITEGLLPNKYSLIQAVHFILKALEKRTWYRHVRVISYKYVDFISYILKLQRLSSKHQLDQIGLFEINKKKL